MPLIQKPNYNQIFASQAPEQDKPAVFNNYPGGWGQESRPNNGKPTIKGFNYLQQTSDLKDLWILQNGACLPYDESIEYADGAPVLKDGVIQYKTAGGFKSRDAVTIPTYNNTADGVDPVTGVADGAYFNVRSSSDESYIDEYQNVGGVPTPTGKLYPSGKVVNELQDGAELQKQINDNQARLNFSTIDNLANSTIPSGGAGTLWAAGAAIFQELAPSATNQSLTTASGVKLAYITPFLKTQVDGDAKTVLDIAHYSKQGSSPVASPNAVSIHDYTDAPRSMQIDKVGGSATDYVLGLRRANNATRRPDKTAEYIGGAGFLRCSYDKFTNGVKSEVLAFYIGPNANFGWSSDPASFTTAKPNNGTYAFTYTASVEAQYVASFSSASGQVLNIQDAISGTRTDIIAPVNQTSGIRIEATGGGIDIAPKPGSPITVRGNLNSTSGTDLTITAVGSNLNINATNGIKSLAPHRFSLHNVGTLPTAANFPNHIILVTDGDAGKTCLAVSDGTSWLRIPLGAAVSAT